MDYAALRNDIDREFYEADNSDDDDSDYDDSDDDDDTEELPELEPVDANAVPWVDEPKKVILVASPPIQPVITSAAAFPSVAPVDHAGNFRILEVNMDSAFREDTVKQTSADWTWLPNQPLRNVIRMELHATEIPNSFFTFTDGSRNNVSMMMDDTELSIDPGNYASVTALVTAVQTKLTSASAGTLAYNATTNRVSWTLPVGTHVVTFLATESRPSDFGLGYKLGFRKHAYADASGTLTAEAGPNVADDAYILLQLDDHDGMMHESYQDTVRAFAKIKVRGAKGSIMHDDPNTLQGKAITFRQPTTVHQLHIRLLEKYGSVLDLDGQEMSLSMRVTSIQNSHLHELYRSADLAGSAAH
jgi:hypothetical protein